MFLGNDHHIRQQQQPIANLADIVKLYTGDGGGGGLLTAVKKKTKTNDVDECEQIIVVDDDDKVAMPTGSALEALVCVKVVTIIDV